MSVILDRFSRPAVRNVRAYYEGANGSYLRSVLPGVVQEARKDLTRATRRELSRNSRNLWKNNPMVKAVFERLITYTVGTGIRPEPDSSNAGWNRRASDVFNEWALRADLTSRLSFWKLQEIAFRSMLIDGDTFCALTYGQSGRPRIQLIEAQQIAHANSSPMGKNDDGVIADANGRAVAYIAQEPIDNGITRERILPADSVVHLANIERPGQQRGASLAASALTTAIDLHDILGLEKGAVKSASAKTDIIKTESGEMPQDLRTIGRSLVSTSEAPSDAMEYYQEIFGPEAKVLKRGDEYTPYIPARPSQAWAGFVDFLAELVCLSFNLPPSLVRQIKVGGADTRRDLATMQRVAEVWQATLAQQWQRVYEYVIEAEIEDGSLAGAPSDWRRTDWQFPRAPTVDAGRQANADREDIRTGSMTLRESCGQFGVPWRTHVRQLAVEMRAVMDAEKEAGLPANALAARLYGGPNGIMPGQPAPTLPAKPAE